MFRVDRTEDRVIIHGVQVQLVMGEHRTSGAMLIPGHARQDNAIDEDVDEQPVQDLALNVDNVFQADDCDAYDSDVDEAPTAQTMFMANLSSADPVCDEANNDLHESDVLFVSHTPRNTVVNNSLNAELATYKEQVELYERRARFELTEREQKIVSMAINE
ncbi:hypothetical protein Tco_1195174 [Tanacetum coccineum]